jgi:hypothetical protein
MNKEYLHNFACWAAARAVQNPNVSNNSTAVIKEAIDKISLYDYVENPNELSNYKTEHNNIVLKLLNELKWNETDRYGVAAKIIAIYFKVTIIIPGRAISSIIEKIYPPIDSYNLSKIIGFEKHKWTELDEKTYQDIITALELQLKKNNSSFIDFEAGNTLITKRK